MKISIFEPDKISVNFLNKYSKNISQFVTESGGKYNGFDTVPLKDFLSAKEKELLIIPNSQHYMDILIKEQQIEFENYLSEKYFGKKVVAIYGNCHTTAISEIMLMCPEFQDDYVVYPILPIHVVKSSEYFSHAVFKHCDVFIHQSIQLHNRYGEEFASENIFKKLKASCRIIAIPNVYHLPMCFFPQYTSDTEFKNRNKETLFFRDTIIDECYAKGYSIKKIIAAYSDESAFDNEDLNHQFSEFIEKIRKREVDWDIKVSEFIQEHYQSVQLFFDPNHPTSFFIKYVCKEILKLLNVDFNGKEIDELKINELDSFEMPICYAVKKNFNMIFKEKEMRVTGRKIKNEKMYLVEYISQYTALEWQNKEVSAWLRGKSFIRWFYMRLTNKLQRILRRI